MALNKPCSLSLSATIAIGEGGVQPVSQLVTGCDRKDKETMAGDDVEQPRRWASDATMI